MALPLGSWRWTPEEWAHIEAQAQRAREGPTSSSRRARAVSRLVTLAGVATGPRPPSIILSPGRAPF